MVTVAGYVGITMLGKNRVIEVIQVDIVGSEIEEENYKLKLNIFIIEWISLELCYCETCIGEKISMKRFGILVIMQIEAIVFIFERILKIERKVCNKMVSKWILRIGDEVEI